MIRLPTFQERAKIATPNKAGTLLGVSPFSSVRNVMAKVQDTSSFIEAARAIHGDRYDYSQTDYVGANQPITIVCRKHGEFTLAWAASHYTKKGSGCQKCSGCEVKVRDTESFIAQSRLIHGDQYDYSLAKFSGCKKPVVIKCKVHGEFVLAEAQSHYGKKHGCRKCALVKVSVEKGNAVKCSFCNEWMSSSGLARKMLVCESCEQTDCGQSFLSWAKWAGSQMSKCKQEHRRAATKHFNKWWGFAINKRTDLYKCIKKSRATQDTQLKQESFAATWECWADAESKTSHFFRRSLTGWEYKCKTMARSLQLKEKA